MGKEQEDVKALRAKLAEARAKARNEVEIKQITEELDALLNPVAEPEKDELELEIEAKQAEIEKLLAEKKKLEDKKKKEEQLESLKIKVAKLSGEEIPVKSSGPGCLKIGGYMLLGFLVLNLLIGVLVGLGGGKSSADSTSSSKPSTSSEPLYPTLKKDGASMRIVSAENIPLSQYEDTVGSAVWPDVKNEFEYVLRVKWAVTYPEGTSYQEINNATIDIECNGVSWCGDEDRYYGGIDYMSPELIQDYNSHSCLFGGCYTSDWEIPYIGWDDPDVLTSENTRIVYTAEFYMSYYNEYGLEFSMFDEPIIIGYDSLTPGNR